MIPVNEYDSQPLDYAAVGRQNRPLAAARVVRPTATRAAVKFARFAASILIGAGAFALLTAALWQVHPGLGIAAGVAWFIFLPALGSMGAEIRRRRAAIILTHLSQATTLNLPLARMLDAARWSESKETGRRLRHLRDLIEDGASLEAALPLATPEVSPRTVALIGAGERLGRLPQALARAVEEHRTRVGDDPSRNEFARWYPIMMTTATLLIVAAIMIFVMPKFMQIFQDFGLRLPQSTRTLIRVADGWADSPIAPVAMAFLLIGVVGSAFYQAFGRARNEGGGDRIGLIDEILWRLPVIHAIQRDRGLGDAMQTIADALRTGHSLPRAIDEATRLRINAVLRDRLARWRGAIEEGARADEAAHRAGLPKLVGGMIASGRGGDPAAAVEFLAAYYGGRFSRTRELIRAAVVPAMALVFGGIVLFVVVAMYSPLVTMIDSLSAHVLEVRR